MDKQTALAELQKSTNKDEWNATCDRIKAANRGMYPEWWYPEVVATNLIEKVLGQDAGQIKIIEM
jgi:hypothetical protein